MESLQSIGISTNCRATTMASHTTFRLQITKAERDANRKPASETLMKEQQQWNEKLSNRAYTNVVYKVYWALYSLYCTFRYNFRSDVLFKVLEHLYTITLLPTTASYGNMLCDNVYKVTCIQSIHKLQHTQNIFSSRWLHFPFSHKVKTWAYKLFNLVRLLNGKS